MGRECDGGVDNPRTVNGSYTLRSAENAEIAWKSQSSQCLGRLERGGIERLVAQGIRQTHMAPGGGRHLEDPMTAQSTLIPTVLMLAASSPGALGGAAQPAEEIVLTGKARDFRARNDGGHTDFQWKPSRGFGHYVGMVADELDDRGKPVMASSGHKRSSNWRDREGRPIMQPRAHFPALDSDTAGSAESGEGGALHSPEEFAQWFRDVPGVNASKLVPITLRRQAGTGLYVFDDREDELYRTLGGFFPINDDLYGNYANTGRNYHFTFELSANFIYSADSGQVFTFIGDDDVWVFIDNKCVIDIGGVHSAVRQTIDLDRLDWLVDGERYSLKFFFAERHTTESNFRIETTINLRTFNLPATTALFD